jgi:hypothetical protein
VIRFSCPHCGRAYVLADALTHLPLVCKGCGQRLSVPDPSPEPEPVLPPPPVKPAPLKLPPPSPAAPRPVIAKETAPPSTEPPADAIDFLATRSRAAIDPNSDEGSFDSSPNGERFAESPESPAPVKKPVAPPAEPAPPRTGRKLLPVVVDVLAVLILVALGVLAGELLVKKSSGQILSESSAAPKFPPVELLMWLAGPVVAGLIYLWLGTRGWTVGGWLKRRAG